MPAALVDHHFPQVGTNFAEEFGHCLVAAKALDHVIIRASDEQGWLCDWLPESEV